MAPFSLAISSSFYFATIGFNLKGPVTNMYANAWKPVKRSNPDILRDELSNRATGIKTRSAVERAIKIKASLRFKLNEMVVTSGD